VHLVGTSHPSPAKAAEFQRVDLPSIQAAVSAARSANVAHLVYVSVAHPARRLGLVTIGQMVRTLVNAVEHPPEPGEMRILEVPKIRRGAASSPLPGPGA
jgi:hypothetical protein